MNTRHDLTDEQWARLEPLLPDRTPQRGGRWIDPRQIIDGVMWRARAGNPWRDLPAEFGPWPTVWARHRGWSEDGTWDKIHTTLMAQSDAAGLAAQNYSIDVGPVPLYTSDAADNLLYVDPGCHRTH